MQLPMFPLSSVLFPGAILPLQVFEPRYRALIDDIGLTDNRFGVVLIRRGSEVGGGDERHELGTIAEIVRKGEAEDGRILITAVGRDRIRIRSWIEGAPYPQAEVEIRQDSPVADDVGAAVARASAARRRLLALAIEMGADGQQLDLDLPDDPRRAAWTLAAAAPVGPFDQQQLLEHDDIVIRMSLLEEMMVRQARDLEEVLRRG